MALKSRNWLFKKALDEERKRTKLAYLSGRALDLGFGSENTSGHILQSWGAVQQFLTAHPQHKTAVRSASPVEPFKLGGQLLTDWKAFLQGKAGPYGRSSFGYDWDHLRTILPPRYGGRPGRSGGAGKNEFEIVLRLAAAFL